MKRRTTAFSAHDPLPEEIQRAAVMDSPRWKPLPESLTRWTGFMLSWIADLGGQEYTQALATIGIQPQHLAILILLEAEGPLVQARIGERLSLVKHTIVTLLNELETWGFAQRLPHPTDKRAFLIHITSAGQQRIELAESVSQQATQRFFAELAPEELQLFHSLLTRLARSKMGLVNEESN